MKRLIKTFVIETAVLYLVSLTVAGLSFSEGFKSLLLTGVALTIATYLAKPVITILLLPLNLITFGVFKWASHTIVLFLVDLVLDEFAITGFAFAGYASEWFNLPAINLPQGIASYIAYSLVLSVITGIFYWLAK
ncbi:hypothetical protein A3F62_04170 [Candidatus Woesebacteria bacterium RIFCSPHIGHO2_12_FULL_44_11]|nr:MAG: hypothetical protein A3F62_04170 [Candidatus Woesebacteria bacterium RIFCSPHIGHO2_12_FULL_44_11]